jgi:transposase
MFTVGLDLHASRSSLEVLDAEGKRFKHLEVRGRWPKLFEAIDREVPKPFAIAYEASCGYGYVHDQLACRASRVEVAHPGQLRLIFRAKRKNDRIDSGKLAKLLYLDAIPKVHVPRKDVRQWRSLIETRRRTLNKVAGVKSEIRSFCRGRGFSELLRGRSQFTRAGIAALKRQPWDELDRLTLDTMLDELQSLRKRKLLLEKELGKIAARYPQVALLMTIPGVGIRTAEAIVAYIDDVSRFGRVCRVAAYFGMIPCQDASSEKNRLGHITKDGPATVRWLLCEAAWQGVRRSPTIRAYHDRICRDDPDRRKIALVATAHYLLRVMTAMLRSGEVWREGGAFGALDSEVEKKEARPAEPARPNTSSIHHGARGARQQSPIPQVDKGSIARLNS